MPDKVATPFIGLALGGIGGDIADFYNIAYGASVGAKVFIGNSASINLALSGQTLKADNDFFEDIDSTAFTVGVSFYFNNR